MRLSSSFPLEFAKRFLLLASGLALVGTAFFLFQSGRYEALRRAEAEALVSVESQIFHETLENTASDVRFLASVFEDRADNLRVPPDSSSALSRLLSAFMLTRPQYHQIRFLDSEGMEKLRMIRGPKGPQLMPASELQDKSHRTYYKRTAAQDAETVYVSAFDLNVEHGVIERPFRPTLRVATQVRLPDGSVGVAIINLDGSKLIEMLRNARHGEDIQALIINDQGNWLVGPHRRMEWGNSLPERQGYTLAARQPDLWMLIGSQPQGVVLNSSGMYAFSRVTTDGENRSGFRVEGDEYWTMLAFVPRHALSPDWAGSFLLLGGVTLLFLALVSALLTRALLHRRQVEQSLQETEEKIQAISHSSHDALIMVDERGRIAFWNPAAESMLGYRSGEVLNAPAAGFLNFTPCAGNNSGPALKAGPFSDFSCVDPISFKRKDGTEFPAEVALSSFRLHGSWWTVNAVRDITKRVSAIHELEKSRDLLMEAQSISRMGGFSLSTSTESGVETVGWTDEMRQLHGVDRDFVPSVDAMADFVEHSHRTAFLNAVGEARKGNPVELEMRLKTAKGRRLWIRLNIRAHFKADKVTRLSGIYQDVTDRKLERIRMEQLSTAVEHSPASVLIMTADGVVEYVNPRFTEVCGYKPAEIIGNSAEMLQSDTLDANFYESLRRSPEGATHWSGEISSRTKDGRTIWQQLSISPIKDEEGHVRHFVGVMEDVTERRRSLEALQASERKIRAMSEATLDAMVVIDETGRISFWNPAASTIFGYSEDEALGREIHALIAAPTERVAATEAMEDFGMTGHGPVVGVTRELMAKRKGGALFPCEITVSSFALDTQWYAVGTIRDITRRKEYERRLRALATTDELTGLLNRRALLELAESELDRARRYRRPFTLLMIDLDRFKRVNDTYGHDVGDKVLKNVASTGAQALRETDTLGRLGGEEFAAILPETSADQALEVAERLRAAIGRAEVEEPAAPGGRLRVTISIGIADFRPDRDTVEAILKAADTALYRAKDNGRNRTETA
ncbi:PAS domain S-box protein [Paucidesulfovibrio longus]|uniref:PAS domain S-box protein n=1 Tax=Paucidesulfovibrio longus TaxID=889 RepID=UPI0003B6F514|nr:PAS domain S-box protein [Paucidesulfovibrio longus]